MAFSECAPAHDDDPIRQGDLFHLTVSVDSSCPYGIVVTADCDIARNKCAGILNYVPVRTLHSYLIRGKLMAYADRAMISLRRRVLKVVHKSQKASVSDEFPVAISEEALDSWIMTSGVQTIADVLSIAKQSDIDLLHVYYTAKLKWESFVDLSFDNAIAHIIDLKEFDFQGVREKAMAKVKGDLGGWISTLPEDVVLINRIPDDETSAYVAELRRIREMEQSAIAINQAMVQANDIRAIRVGRLTSPYRYFLTQRLGSVFSSIGLPAEYEENRDFSWLRGQTLFCKDES